MASYEIERERFMVAMEAEGMSRDIARRILRHANTIQRCATLACSSEAADWDRVPCPDPDNSPCLCEDYGTIEFCGDGQARHGTVPRIAVTSARAERLIRKWCDKAGPFHLTCWKPVSSDAAAPGLCTLQRGHAGEHNDNGGRPFVPVFSGDPRGACVKIRVPSGKSDSWGGDGICVPTRGLPARAFR